MDALVSVVAGCLFEVSLPGGSETGWRWTAPTADVTLLAEESRDGRQHFRFRAEAAGAAAGAVCLQFRAADGREAEVVVGVAPERLAGEES
jgi:hypothetical protein